MSLALCGSEGRVVEFSRNGCGLSELVEKAAEATSEAQDDVPPPAARPRYWVQVVPCIGCFFNKLLAEGK
jgi:hypothetical protein